MLFPLHHIIMSFHYVTCHSFTFSYNIIFLILSFTVHYDITAITISITLRYNVVSSLLNYLVSIMICYVTLQCISMSCYSTMYFSVH